MKKDFKRAELITKTSLYFRDRPKNGEGNKGDVESICARVTNMHQNMWRKLRLIWIDYEQLIMDFFHCILKSTDNLAHLIPVLWLVSWFLCFFCSICSKSMKSMKSYGNISTGFAKVLLFVKNYYFKQKLSFLINTLFG